MRVTAKELMNEFEQLMDQKHPNEEVGIDLFDRWISYLSQEKENDPDGYEKSIPTIFSLIYFLSEMQLINDEMGAEMGKKAVTIIRQDNQLDRDEFLKLQIKKLKDLFNGTFEKLKL